MYNSEMSINTQDKLKATIFTQTDVALRFSRSLYRSEFHSQLFAWSQSCSEPCQPNPGEQGLAVSTLQEAWVEGPAELVGVAE